MARFWVLLLGPLLAITDTVMRDQLEQLKTWLTSKRTLTYAGSLLGAAILLSWGAMAVLESKLALPAGADGVGNQRVESTKPEARPPARAPKKDRARSFSWYKKPILKRNIFDPDATQETVVSDESEGTTDLPVKLVATVVTDPMEFSTAIIAEDKRGSAAQVYVVGDTLMDEATIEEIHWRKVVIRKDGERQAILMDEDKGVNKSRKSSSSKNGIDADGIEKAGDDHYTVPQSVMDNALEDLDKLASQVRVRPHRDSSGKVDGYRLSAIRRGTLLDKLGIKNGDIIHEVNGYPINSNSGAMTAFQSLTSESAFQFDISRRNKRRTMKYDVR